MIAGIRFAVLFALLALGLPAAEKKAPPWERQVEMGRDLYRENCVVCHDIESAETQKRGPSLFRLFQNEKLPYSGGKPSLEYVRFKTQFGGDEMPAFLNRLTADQIDEVIAFIRSKK